MTKAIFYIKDGVQEVGYRLYIIEKILNSNLNGTALNLPDGRIKVLLEGEKERILEFIEELKKEKLELAKNPQISTTEFDEKLVVPESMKSSQALQLEQFGKSVVYLTKMSENMEKGFNNIGSSLGGKIDALGDSLGSKIDSLGDSLGSKIDSLPERIAKAMKP